MTDPTTPSTFSRFPQLPTELRLQIWEAALPTPTNPTLVPFRPGLWHFDGPKILRFRHDLLDVHIPVPLVHVSHEARNVALAWARIHGFQHPSRVGQSGNPGFSRPFDRSTDAVYLGPGQLEELLAEEFSLAIENFDLVRCDCCSCATDRPLHALKFAMEEELARNLVSATLGLEMFEYWVGDMSLLVIVGETPQVRAQLGYVPAPGAVFVLEDHWWSEEGVRRRSRDMGPLLSLGCK